MSVCCPKRTGTVLALLTVLVCNPSAPWSAPSFRCDGSLNIVEKSICNDALLGDLDRRMAQLYRTAVATAGHTEQARIKSAQRFWLNWRDACTPNIDGCIRRRYEQRIIDLAPAGSLAPGFGGATVTSKCNCNQESVTRRVRGDRYEVVHQSGRIDWWSSKGDAYGSLDPSTGVGSSSLLSQAVASTFPALPSDYTEWGDALESSLLGVIDELLPEQDRAPYRALHTNKHFSERVLSHIQAIRFLTNVR